MIATCLSVARSVTLTLLCAQSKSFSLSPGTGSAALTGSTRSLTPSSRKIFSASSAVMALRTFPDEQAHEVLPNLFIGGQVAANNKQALLENSITHILTTTGTQPPYPDEFIYKVITLADHGGPISADIGPCLSFIEQGRASGGGVLVHCGGGSGRSGTITVAAVMKEKGLSVDDALALVKERRPIVQPPEPFMVQLRELSF